MGVEENAQNSLIPSFRTGLVEPKACFGRIKAVLMLRRRRLANILFSVCDQKNTRSVLGQIEAPYENLSLQLYEPRRTRLDQGSN